MPFNPVDVMWVLVSAGLVFVMQAGFLCLEAGLTRTKNSINVAIKNVTDLCLSILLFWGVGYALMFGLSRSGVVGQSGFFPDFGASDPWQATFFLFQAMFCGTAVTIVSGAVAERMKFLGYLVMAVVVALLYPIFGHWVWGEGGWLAEMGFVDFAGSTVVHSLGGWAALAACLVVGARLNHFNENGQTHNFPGSNLPLAMLGALLLWFGWIGFNGGSTLGLTTAVPGIIANTMLAAAAGLVAASSLAYAHQRYVDPSSVINGVLSGLVAITANCHAVSAVSAVLIGLVAGVVVYVVQRLLVHWRIDDVIGAVPVHLAAGAWGTLAVAFFGKPDVLGTGLPFWSQVGVQAIGIAVCAAWTFGLAFPIFWAAHKLFGLRVAAVDEQQGLNVSEHRATNDLLVFAQTLEAQAEKGLSSERAYVEPFTEVGMIAERYNALMDVLETSTTDIETLRQAEASLQEALKDAESANAAKTEFLANMSHEIRTPLHGILCFAGFGRKRAHTSPPEKLEEYFSKIGVSGDRLLELVNDLLDLSKLEAGKMNLEPKWQDVERVIAGVVDEMDSLLAERDIEVVFDRPSAKIEAEIDATRMMQVIRNLLSNAVKFTPVGSTVHLTLTKQASGYSVTVRDHGPGIPEGELESIFDKFVQSTKTKSGAGGTGLGLSIVQEIVAGHGGRVYARNHAEGGAIFTVEIPDTVFPQKAQAA